MIIFNAACEMGDKAMI